MDIKTASDVYTILKAVSELILAAMGMQTEPRNPTRTKKWKNGRPLGIIYHYTAGVSFLGAMRWANDASQGNSGSSWHVTICDRVPDDKLGELWLKHTDAAMRKLFPVPTIIMADFRWGTWHGNWTNDVTIGIENRNSGYWGYNKLGKDGLTKLGKSGIEIGGKTWEEYTREQIVANINMGRLINGWVDGQLDPDWILPHSAIWATKQDVGPAFPLFQVRANVFNDDNLHTREWLVKFPMAPDKYTDEDALWTDTIDANPRDDVFRKWPILDPNKKSELDDETVAHTLFRLGFNTGPEVPDHDILAKQIRWFQRSTSAYGAPDVNKPELILGSDSVVGPKTKAELIRRLGQFGMTL